MRYHLPRVTAALRFCFLSCVCCAQTCTAVSEHRIRADGTVASTQVHRSVRGLRTKKKNKKQKKNPYFPYCFDLPLSQVVPRRRVAAGVRGRRGRRTRDRRNLLRLHDTACASWPSQECLYNHSPSLWRWLQVRTVAEENGVDVSDSVEALEARAIQLRQHTYSRLTPVQRLQVRICLLVSKRPLRC